MFVEWQGALNPQFDISTILSGWKNKKPKESN